MDTHGLWWTVGGIVTPSEQQVRDRPGTGRVNFGVAPPRGPAETGATPVPARELGRLIERLHPGQSVRSLERAAGAAPQTVQRWLKDSTEYNRLPDPRAIREVARVLGARVADVVHAFNDSLDDPLPLNQLPDDELELLFRYRALAPVERGHLLAIAKTFAVHSDGSDATPSGSRHDVDDQGAPATGKRSRSRQTKSAQHSDGVTPRIRVAE